MEKLIQFFKSPVGIVSGLVFLVLLGYLVYTKLTGKSLAPTPAASTDAGTVAPDTLPFTPLSPDSGSGAGAGAGQGASTTIPVGVIISPANPINQTGIENSTPTYQAPTQQVTAHPISVATTLASAAVAQQRANQIAGQPVTAQPFYTPVAKPYYTPAPAPVPQTSYQGLTTRTFGGTE